MDHELRKRGTSRVIVFGSQRLTISYPQSLAAWLDPAIDAAADGGAPVGGVSIDVEANADTFRVTSTAGDEAGGLDPGDAIATFWDRVTFLLIDTLADALALHAAAARREGDLILLPGPSGAGKTHLALWYREQGFALETDELVGIAPAAELKVSTLRRPLFLKDDCNALLRATRHTAALNFSQGTMVWTEEAGVASSSIGQGLIVFPHFVAGAQFRAIPLTAAQTGFQLLASTVNIRNLPSNGLTQAIALGRRLPAVWLTYGSTEQLTGTLDVLTRQVLAARPDQPDFVALCEAFTARAARQPAALAPSPEALARTDRREVPEPTLARFPRRLTVGMATYDDYDGVFFTIQAIRTYHPELAGALEFVVIDNNPGGPCSEALKNLGHWIDAYRYIPRGDWSGTAIRNAVFEEASSQIVLCVDSHVLIAPGALSRLIDHFEALPDCRDLVQGPLLYDDLRTLSTHFEPRWRAGMYGIWATDPRGTDTDAPSFEIPMQGLGVFACRRAAWPGFNPLFRGFGGEEGYIHEKFRRRGGRTLCLPRLRWVHRFRRPLGASYANTWEDRIRNYFIGFTELGWETGPMEAHFTELLGADMVEGIVSQTREELAGQPISGRALQAG